MLPSLSRAVLVVLLLTMSACNSDDPERSAEDRSPPPAESDSTQIPAEEDDGTLEGAATALGSLKPGRYQTRLFEPAVSFEVGSGWSIPEENSDYILLLHAPEPRDEAIYLDSSQAGASVSEALQFLQETFVGTPDGPGTSASVGPYP